jgi:hypothetical protein
LATPITGTPNSACARAPRPGRGHRIQVGVAVDHQQAKPAQILQDRAQRRELAQVELPWLVGRHLGQHRGVLGQHAGEGGVGRQHGCRLGAPAGR